MGRESKGEGVTKVTGSTARGWTGPWKRRKETGPRAGPFGLADVAGYCDGGVNGCWIVTVVISLQPVAKSALGGADPSVKLA